MTKNQMVQMNQYQVKITIWMKQFIINKRWAEKPKIYQWLEDEDQKPFRILNGYKKAVLIYKRKRILTVVYKIWKIKMNNNWE